MKVTKENLAAAKERLRKLQHNGRNHEGSGVIKKLASLIRKVEQENGMA